MIMAKKTIVTGGDWAHFDTLEDKPLEDGECLFLYFPNGVAGVEKIIVKHFHKHEPGATIPCSSAFITYKVNGAYLLLSILGLEAERL